MQRRTLLTIPLALAATGLMTTPVQAGGPATPGGHGARVLTVMTFNIHHGEGADGVVDLERIAGIIRDSGADLIGLQEVDRHFSERSGWADQPAELAERLGFHVAFGANIDEEPPEGRTERSQYGTAILSRHPITHAENIPLTSSADQEQRGLLRAVVDVRGRTVEFCSTHLEAFSAADRQVQAQQLVELIGAKERAVVVGDMNAEPEDPEIAPLREAFVDAWDAAGHGDGATYPAEAPSSRIDAIYGTGAVRPVVTRVLSGSPEASDHLPIISRIVLRP
ncbi:endonuclease/exonuclease/phosphatase family protein [Brachybacterium hainanense]|uniref:Endonuclease/exonuclease/phosphatase family protein n=1 Tax=Brachybacterium hainanense TaxID=1541174 RepID=A0ABV6RGU9_9MICO